METIKLDIKDVVRNARAAYNAKELQAQKEHVASTTGIACQYSGPCAIGVSIPEDVRATLDDTKRWDGDTSIDHLINQGAIDVGGSAVVKGEFLSLQTAHDDWTISGTPVSEEQFLKTLTNLESKYGVAA